MSVVLFPGFSLFFLNLEAAEAAKYSREQTAYRREHATLPHTVLSKVTKQCSRLSDPSGFRRR